MDKKAFQTLEFDKILAALASYTQNEKVKGKIIGLMPDADAEEVRCRLEETTEAVSLILRRGNPPSLKIMDITAEIARSQMGGLLNMKELLAVCHILKTARGLKRYVLEDKLLPENVIFNHISQITPLSEVEHRISDCIISEEEMADNASPELYQIRRRKKSLSSKVRETLNEIISNPKYQKILQDPIITMRGERYVVPLKAEHKGELRGIVHDSSSSGSTLFVEPMAVVTITNELADLQGKEKEEMERILAELSADVSEYSDPIIANITVIYELDFIFCKGKLSIAQNAMSPVLNEEGYIKIRKGRHPLLDPKTVVPIDIYLGGEFDTLVITGPNTGGKTVSLKTLGLFTLMAQAGLHIPVADNSQIAVFDNVFADIGDEQSIEQSLSTFSSHIVNLVGILKRVGHKDLVLADELGAGTDPTEGAALAIAILEFIRSRGAKSAATTHYSELKMYALSTEGVENASCEFDVATLSPTYKLLIGVPGKSNAFAISKRLGLHDSIIHRAKTIMSDENIRLEDVIIELEENKQRAEQEKEKAEYLSRDARILKDNIRKEKEELEQKRTQIIENARREALKIIEEAKEDTQNYLKEIRTIKDSAVARDSQREIEKSRATLKDKTDKIMSNLPSAQRPKGKAPKNLKMGEEVHILTLGQDATVLSLPDQEGNLQVQAGIIKINVNTRDLQRKEQEKPKQKKTNPTGYSRGKPFSATLELDVRGRTLDEALLLADKFIDDAFLSSLQQVTIIHGKGTGVLRKGIQDFLKRHKSVKEYRLGRYGEGEDGVTLITLK